MKIDISRKEKTAVLIALFNNAIPKRAGKVNCNDYNEMTLEEANKILNKYTYLGYLHGRELRINFSSDMLDTSEYNKANGIEAKAIIDKLPDTI